MEIKANFQGLLIYLTIAAYIAAFVFSFFRAKKAGHLLYLIGYIIAVVSFGYRWINVKHVPLQNLFEVFLCLGMVYPLTMFCRFFLRIGAEPVDMLLGVIVLVPAGFFFNDQPQHLPPALQSWLFAPHVAVYMMSYLLMAKAAVQAFGVLFCKQGCADNYLVSYEEGAYRMVCFGFPLLT